MPGASGFPVRAKLIQIPNDDTNSAAGRHTMIHRNYMLNNVILAKIDIGSEPCRSPRRAGSSPAAGRPRPEPERRFQGLNLKKRHIHIKSLLKPQEQVYIKYIYMQESYIKLLQKVFLKKPCFFVLN